jgi:glycosyltransferase involved in cell wall biosynthesis
MNNFISLDFNKNISSNLSPKTILMLGRADGKKKISYLNKVMEYIVNEIPECKLLIISDLNGTGKLIKINDNINLLNNTIFIGYTNALEKM